MAAHRMNRDQFFEQLALLDEDGLKTALWTLYWRGSAPMRQRIEIQLDPDASTPPQQHRERQPPDAATVFDEVRHFVALARSGAYLGGDRRVSPRERTRWRFTFRRLATDAQQALRGDDLDTAADAVELLVDLACEMRGYEYFRSDDPVQAAGFVVSDAVGQLWATVRDRRGVAGFADDAAPQLIRWESAHGWTRSGNGRVADQETTLAEVLAAMLPTFDLWSGFAGTVLGCARRAHDHRRQGEPRAPALRSRPPGAFS